MNRLDNIRKWVTKNKLAAFIILCAVFLRMWRIQDFAMFLADQGRDAIIIRDIATFKHFPLIGPPSSIGQVYLGPFFYYLMAPFLLLFLFNPAGLAYGVSLLSLLGLVTAYYFISRIEKKPAALIFLILATFSYQLIMLSRFSWNPNLLPVFAFFTLFFLYKALSTKKPYYSILYGVFFALSFQLHHLAAFLAVPIAISYLYALIADKKKAPLLFSPIISFLSFVFISSPLILFDLKHGFLNIKNLSSLFAHQNVVAGGSPLGRLLETNHAFWEIILHISYPQAVSTFLSIFMIILLSCLAYKRKVGLFLVIHMVNFFSFLYFFSFLSSPRHPHYYGSVYLSFFLILGFIGAQVARKSKAIFFICALLLVLYVGVNAKDYFFIAGEKNSQIDHSEKVALSIVPYIGNKPFNFATYPVEFTSEEAYLYFLKKEGLKVADREAREVTEQMFVLCNKEPCNVLNSQSWNIEMFGKAKVDKMWETDGIKIFRLVHEK